MPFAGPERIDQAPCLTVLPAWLVTHKVLLPGASVLERSIARVRTRASDRLWRRLAVQITPDQKERLEALVIPAEGSRQPP